jgi:hypothetical protein
MDKAPALQAMKGMDSNQALPTNSLRRQIMGKAHIALVMNRMDSNQVLPTSRFHRQTIGKVRESTGRAKLSPRREEARSHRLTTMVLQDQMAAKQLDQVHPVVGDTGKRRRRMRGTTNPRLGLTTSILHQTTMRVANLLTMEEMKGHLHRMIHSLGKITE